MGAMNLSPSVGYEAQNSFLRSLTCNTQTQSRSQSPRALWPAVGRQEIPQVNLLNFIKQCKSLRTANQKL